VRVAALNDVHGNLPALQAVLAEMAFERIDLIVFGGDLAAGPFPRETVVYAGNLPNARFVRGNADRYLVEAFDGAVFEGGLVDTWAAAQLEREHRDFLESFEPTVSVDGVLYCHATPQDDETIFTRITPDDRLRALMEGVEERVVVCGHTHVQFDRGVDDLRVVNAGSVGLAYGTPNACWAILDGGEVELRETSYDRELLRLSEYDKVDVFLRETSAEEATAFFESQAASA
jgi:putative phosphoesterase